jgi:hypothetical protein
MKQRVRLRIDAWRQPEPLIQDTSWQLYTAPFELP